MNVADKYFIETLKDIKKNSGAWFQTSWFCFGCGLSSDLNFVSLK